MTRFILLAGAAAFALAGPVAAKPGGGGGMGHAMSAHGPSMHANVHATGGHGPSMHASRRATAHSTHVRNAHATSHARNSHATSHAAHASRAISAHDQALAHKYGGALCPPGLYKKTPSCMPPGQAKRLFHTGQRVNTNYRYYTPYGDIPAPLVSQYGLTDQYRYIYRNNVIYVVDPTTNLVTRIMNAVL